MIFDMAWKIGRKSLPGGWYDLISYKILGRSRLYERLETYAAIHRHYRDRGLEFGGRKVVEAGCGRQLYTALHMLADGASEVILAEPKLELTPDFLAGHVQRFNAAHGAGLKAQEAAARIRVYRDLSQVPERDDGTVDLLCSYTVLEHVPDVGGFFRDTARILRPGGTAYHHVDLSDHTYQVFARIPFAAGLNRRRGLYHLRYSNALFRRLNDPKCYMNRMLLPQYLEAARAGGFSVASLDVLPFGGEIRIHPDLLAGIADGESSRLGALVFSLSLTR